MGFINRYTYGVKTSSQIASITGMQSGETVFNSERFKVETYNGTYWLNSDMIVLTNKSGGTLVEGDVVVVDTTNDNSVTTTTTLDDTRVIGPVVYSATNNTQVVIAVRGIYKVNADGAVTRGSAMFCSTTAKQAYDVASGAPGEFAVAVESIGSAGLVKCLLTNRTEFF